MVGFKYIHILVFKVGDLQLRAHVEFNIFGSRVARVIECTRNFTYLGKLCVLLVWDIHRPIDLVPLILTRKKNLDLFYGNPTLGGTRC